MSHATRRPGDAWSHSASKSSARAARFASTSTVPKSSFEKRPPKVMSSSVARSGRGALKRRSKNLSTNTPQSNPFSCFGRNGVKTGMVSISKRPSRSSPYKDQFQRNSSARFVTFEVGVQGDNKPLDRGDEWIATELQKSVDAFLDLAPLAAIPKKAAVSSRVDSVTSAMHPFCRSI